MIDLIQRHKWWLFGIILLGCLAGWIERWWNRREHSQDAVILVASRKHGVDPALVKAVVWRESWFDPNARGTSGEVGLMQIMKDTANDWAKAQRVTLFTHEELFDPGMNTECGAWYLRRLLGRYQATDHPVIYALAAYNAGPTRVAKWRQGSALTNSSDFLRQMEFPGTRKYVLAIKERYRVYQGTFPGMRSKGK